jgi:hypothetical protein
MRDPLAVFGFREDKPAKPEPQETGSGELSQYLASDAKDRSKYLQIRTARGIHRAPAYAYLLDVIHDGERGTEIALLFSFMMVEIRGRNLQETAISLLRRECAFIEEFNHKAFILPKPTEAIIESIDITVKE